MGIRLILLILLSASPLLAREWVMLTSLGAVIHAHPGQEALAREVADLVAAELPRVAAGLGAAEAGPFHIYVYESRREFERVAGADPAVRGISERPGGTIRLRADDAPALRRTLAHELAHSVVDQRLGARVAALPRWVDEGIAGHLSEPLTPDETRAVSQLVHRDGVLGLTELSPAFAPGPRRDAAYLQSRSMVAWLVRRQPDAVPRLLDRLARGQRFEDALPATAGLAPEEWWDGWRRDVPAASTWLPVLASPIVFAPLGLLIILIGWRRLRQRRARLAEDDPDETDDGAGLPEDGEVGYIGARSSSQAQSQAEP